MIALIIFASFHAHSVCGQVMSGTILTDCPRTVIQEFLEGPSYNLTLMESHPNLMIHSRSLGYMIMSYFDNRGLCETITHGLTSEKRVQEWIDLFNDDPMAIPVGENLWEYHEGIFVSKVSLNYVGDSAEYPTFFVSREFATNPLSFITLIGHDPVNVRERLENPEKTFVESVTSEDARIRVRLKSGGYIVYFFDQANTCNRIEYFPTTNPELRKLVYRIMVDESVEATANDHWEYRKDSTVLDVVFVPLENNDLFKVQVTPKKPEKSGG